MAENTQSYLSRGLEEAEAADLAARGLANTGIAPPTKSVGAIVRSNLCTLFNAVNAALALVVLSLGEYKNMLFMGVVLSNLAIGIFQELRAKRIVDRLSVLSAPKAAVLRGGERREVALCDVVQGDLLLLSPGAQICADGEVAKGECEVNEALVTGESEPVTKRAGDELLSGSFVVSGNASARVTRVGGESYAARITKGARFIKKPNSQIMKALNAIIRAVSVAILPVGALLYAKQYFQGGQDAARAILSTVAAVIGMIPEGLVLLTSIVLAVAVIRLSQKNTLVQELYCIETLARVDVLCLDKTGTITEGTLNVEELSPVGSAAQAEAEEALSLLSSALDDDNPTMRAVRERYRGGVTATATARAPFSSARKWSGATFSGKGSFILGACEFVLPAAPEGLKKRLAALTAGGRRVLLLARSKAPLSDYALPEGLEPMAFLVLTDTIRAEAPETLAYFDAQGVEIKIISGDSAAAVAGVAERAGVKNADRFVDAHTLTDDMLADAAARYTVFGRVTPERKLALIRALKAEGHTVAMTGDGVNDVLALREADCSIAMASGSDAARNVSQLVLLDSNFASMPLVVAEGRRSINNIQRSASLFLVKTVYACLLALLFLFLPFPYPFVPIQLTLISSLTIGIPSFLLALEPNRERVRGSFIANVMKKALPGGLCIVINVLLVLLAGSLLSLQTAELSSLAVLVTGMTGLFVLYRVCRPVDALRLALSVFLTLAFAAAVVFFHGFFSIVPPGSLSLSLLVLFAALTPLFLGGLTRLVSALLSRPGRTE